MSKSYSFKWDDGTKAKFTRDSSGSVIYYLDGVKKFIICEPDWLDLVKALQEAPLPTESSPRVGEIVGWRCWRVG